MEHSVYLKKEGGRLKGGTVTAGIGFAAVIIILCGICALTFMIGRFMSGEDSNTAFAEVEKHLPVIVIDAGHGGVDGGASGPDGTVEKDINLAVAQRLRALCRAAGLECVMTRTDDRMLVDDSVKDHRKMQDLKNRLKVVSDITESGKDAVFVSIHMNKFSVPKYSGLQVWYSTWDEQSGKLAAFVQSYARTWLDTSNSREIKKSTSSIYILDRIRVPAILVECGFLSNPEELAKLKTDGYRTAIAVTVFAALCDWMSNSPF